MCRVTVGETAADEALQRLQQELEQLQLQQGGGCSMPDFRGIPGCKGSGPRLFCGHVPKEATEDLVRAHFSRWGTVTDVYFPRHKKTLKRRPFCFVTFASVEAAERALAESPLNICGIPIKNLTMVEDRDAYYRTKHANTRAALLQALQSIGSSPNGQLGPDQLNNLAALLAMEGVTAEAVVGLLPQGNSSMGGFGGLQAEALLGSGTLPGGMMGGAYAPSAPAPSTGLYDSFAPRQLVPPAGAGYAPQSSRYAPGPAGYGMPGSQSLDLQFQQINAAAQQALLASRVQLQQAVSGAMQQAPAPAVSAAMLQQYGMPPQQYAPQQPQFAPQLVSAMHQPTFMGGRVSPPPAAAGWGVPPPMRAPAPAGAGLLPQGLPAGIHLGGPASSASHSSGSGSPLGAPAPQISLDEALAALSKLKAAQAAQQAEHAAAPSAEILAGLGSASTSTFNSSPALAGSPNLGTSPPSEGGSLLASCNASLELPAGGLWAMDARRVGN